MTYTKKMNKSIQIQLDDNSNNVESIFEEE